jgi:hypothetical protein
MKTKTEQDLEKGIEKYHKAGKEDIEIYYDDDFANIQRFRGRITHYKKEAKLEGYQLAKKEIKDKIERFLVEILIDLETMKGMGKNIIKDKIKEFYKENLECEKK